jgi:hypothetical protein
MSCSKPITIAVFALLATAWPLLPASAAPVTLKFEATVSSLFNEWAATPDREAPPIILHIGDVITGSVTFDPSVPLTSGNNWSQPYGFQLTIAGVELSTSDLGGWVLDDRRSSFVNVDAIYTGPVTPNPVVVAGDRWASPAAPAVDDRIELTTYREFPNASNLVPGNQDWHWQPALRFSGPTSVLSVDDYLPSQQSVWDAMTEKTFRFGLARWVLPATPENGAFPSPVMADAAITSLTIVPEPSALLCAVVAGTALVACRFGGRSHRPHTDYRSPTS